MDYALINSNVVQNVIVADSQSIQPLEPDWQAIVDITNLNPMPGIGWGYVNGQFVKPAPPPPPEPTWIISKAAFQARFPLTADGVATKYDLMTLFLSDAGYAQSLGVVPPELYALRQQIITGTNRLAAAYNIDLKNSYTIEYVNLLTGSQFPSVFRLTQAEADAILNTPA